MITVNTLSSDTDEMLSALADKLNLPADADIFICSPSNRKEQDAAMKIIVCDESLRDAFEADCSDGEFVLTKPISFSAFAKIASSACAIPISDAESFSFDIKSGIVTRGEKSVTLTHKESELFAYLLAHRRRPVSRESLREALWRDSEGTNAPDVYISYLRRKLRVLFGDGVITNERGVGYVLKNL